MTGHGNKEPRSESQISVDKYFEQFDEANGGPGMTPRYEQASEIEAGFAHRQEERARFFDKVQADVDYWDYWDDQRIADSQANQPPIEDTSAFEEYWQTMPRLERRLNQMKAPEYSDAEIDEMEERYERRLEDEEFSLLWDAGDAEMALQMFWDAFQDHKFPISKHGRRARVRH
jgi:hypothetical protein